MFVLNLPSNSSILTRKIIIFEIVDFLREFALFVLNLPSNSSILTGKIIIFEIVDFFTGIRNACFEFIK